MLIADLAQGQRGDPLQVSLSGKLPSTDIRELKAGRHGEDQVRKTERGRLRRLQTPGEVWGVSEKRSNHPAGRWGERHTLQAQRGSIRNVSDSQFTGRESLLVGPSPVV